MPLIMVNNHMLQNYGQISLEELDQHAAENMERLMPHQLISMNEFFEQSIGVSGISFDVPEIYLLTNEQNVYGASCILDPAVMDEAAKRAGERFYVIPSSVHETLIVPYDAGYTCRELEQMVHEVNLSELSDTDILSEKVYVVDAANHTFLRADQIAEHEAELSKQEEIRKSFKRVR